MSNISSAQLDAVSQIALRQHRMSNSETLLDFQASALDTIGELLEFDGAWWGLVSGMEVHNTFELGLPDNYRANWETVKEHDTIAQAALANPYTTVCYTLPPKKTAQILIAFCNLITFLQRYAPWSISSTKTTSLICPSIATKQHSAKQIDW